MFADDYAEAGDGDIDIKAFLQLGVGPLEELLLCLRGAHVCDGLLDGQFGDGQLGARSVYLGLQLLWGVASCLCISQPLQCPVAGHLRLPHQRLGLMDLSLGNSGDHLGQGSLGCFKSRIGLGYLSLQDRVVETDDDVS